MKKILFEGEFGRIQNCHKYVQRGILYLGTENGDNDKIQIVFLRTNLRVLQRLTISNESSNDFTILYFMIGAEITGDYFKG